jgi:adenosylhomocysteinase
MAGAHVTLIDPDPHVRPPSGCALVSAEDQDAVRMLISHAWCVASATGRPGALSPLTESLARSRAVLANLGAEDEFGPQMPATRVLNHKAPVNFALAEPTRLRYLDATFGLHNACAVELLTSRPPASINRPPRSVEDAILTIARTRSAISEELSAMEEEWR